eukprot:896175_1
MADTDDYEHDLDTIDHYMLLEKVKDIIDDAKYNLELTMNEEIESKACERYEVDPRDGLLHQRIKNVIVDLQKQNDMFDPPLPELIGPMLSVCSDDDVNEALSNTTNEKKTALRKLLSIKQVQAIKDRYRNQMSNLLQQKKYGKDVKQSLVSECEDAKCNANMEHTDDIDILRACPCIQRICVFLSVYHEFDDAINTLNVPPQLGDCFELEEVEYDFISLSNDFQHIQKQHMLNNHQMQKRIAKEIGKTYPCTCESLSCHIEKRRSRAAKKHKKYKASNVFIGKLDDLHSYFLHSDLQKGCRLDPNDDAEAPQDEIAKPLPYDQVSDKEWLNKIQHIEPTRENRIYKTLLRHAGVFTWQATTAFRVNNSGIRTLSHIKPTHANVKEEVLRNPFHSLSIDSWNQALRQSQKFKQTFECRRIQTQQDGKYTDQIFGHNESWKSRESPSVKELVVLKLYTDWADLQVELKKCFRLDTIDDIFQQFSLRGIRLPTILPSPMVQTKSAPDAPSKSNIFKLKDPQNNTKQTTEIWDASPLCRAMSTVDFKYDADECHPVDILQTRLAQFYHWRGRLILFLHKFSTLLTPTRYAQGKEKEFMLYHGVNQKMILNPSATQSFDGPLSTSSSYHVAATFATKQGMVLSITSQFPRLQMCKVFDASIISGYPEEHEWLIAHVYLRVRNVSTRYSPKKTVMATQIKFAFFAIHLFRQQMFSMSPTLEQFIIPFINIHLFKVSSVRSDMTTQSSIYDDH